MWPLRHDRSERQTCVGVMFRLNRLRQPVNFTRLGMIAIVPLFFSATSAQAQTKVSPGFSPNPIELQGTGGGGTSVSAIINHSDSPTGECTGFANSQPNHTLVLTQAFDSLSVLVQSADDTALAIRGPGGVWCNDDLDGKNPRISGQWQPGTYQIWVSSYAKDRRPDYVLQIRQDR